MEVLTSKKYFEGVSRDWDQMGNSFFGEAPRSAIMQALDLQEGALVADIGCGTGYLTEGFDTTKVRVKAVDQSPEMLRVLAKKMGDNAQVEYLVGHSESLPIQDHSADAVVANMYLHHVENPASALKEMVRILKPGGVLVFTDLDTHQYEFLVTEQHDRWMGFERSDIARWMTEAGLDEVVMDCVGSNCCADSCSSGERAEIDIFIAKGKKLDLGIKTED